MRRAGEEAQVRDRMKLELISEIKTDGENENAKLAQEAAAVAINDAAGLSEKAVIDTKEQCRREQAKSVKKLEEMLSVQEQKHNKTSSACFMVGFQLRGEKQRQLLCLVRTWEQVFSC